ncbi:heme o synthase [Alteromonas sp. KUL150]|uniref:heme o synthase n=1 Tax=unclassified Alteromonas TaxID=2614992 RepID=UPI0012E6C1A4|nr:heme o synthase [Alteromonas sp. KUL150]GFD72299.1 protoheme IX farnesyltransferase [Tenacibaculum sp. KUL113]GFD85724.1 protoheme IX farnesyltransferase [Alteromonas sp. KUL150]
MAKSVSLHARSSRQHQVVTWRDYYEMTKPNVVMLLLLTALVGMCLATPYWVNAKILIGGLLGIGMLSASAAVINHVVDHKIDSVMARTFNRPVAKGKVSINHALWFAGTLGVLGFVVLALFVNMLTAWLTLASLVGYAFIYTMYLKRATPQNIVIGGLAGAAPPLLGWTAVTGEVHSHALLLVLIIFTWTPPHFWALAIHREKDYAKAKVPMLPVTHGVAFTKTSVLLYTVLLGLVCLLPYLTGMSDLIYLIGSSLLNIGFLYYALKLKFDAQPETAMKTFRFSIIHLMVLFVVLLLDHYVPLSL